MLQFPQPICCCLLVLLLPLLLSCDAASEFNHTERALEDLVTHLPGLNASSSINDNDKNNSFDFSFFSGHLQISDVKRIYYSLVEAKSRAREAPLVIWMNGGPGCSGMVSFLTQIGPFSLISPENDLPTEENLENLLEMNPHSWNNLANVLFIEQPIGVGYSYTLSSTSSIKYSDELSAVDNLLAIEAFFERFPDFQEQDIYLASQAYGGHFTIQLLEKIHWFSKGKDLYNRIKGIAIGNPFVDFNTGYVAQAEALWGMQLIPRTLWKPFKDAMCTDIQTYPEFLASKKGCKQMFDAILSSVGRFIDLNNINFDVCKKSDKLSSSSINRGKIEMNRPSAHFAGTSTIIQRRFHQLSNGESLPKSSKNGDYDDNDDGTDDNWYDIDDYAGILNFDKEDQYEECVYHYMTAFLNRNDVREALHVPNHITWVECNEDVQSEWPIEDFFGSSFTDFESVVQRNQNLMSLNASEASDNPDPLRILIYSGDNDMICPTVGTQRWVNELPHDHTSLWRPWYFSNKATARGLGGYVTQYDSMLSLVTLHDGGHMVAAYRPRQAYEMMSKFLFSEEFFVPPEEVKVLKLYYSLTLQEYRLVDGEEQEGMLNSNSTDEGFEFIRDAIRHCLFHAENITISGKLVDVFDIKVHNSYEVDLDAVLQNHERHGPAAVDDDFLRVKEAKKRRLYSFGTDSSEGSSWNGLVYDKREVVVVSVEVVLRTFEHLYDLKTEIDVAFDTALYTGYLESILRKALHAHHDLQGEHDGLYSDIINVVLEVESTESLEWFSADYAPLSKKQDFDSDSYRTVMDLLSSYADDDLSDSWTTEIEMIEYSAVNLGIAIVVCVLTVIVVVGTFTTYRHHHDFLMNRLGYEIQEDMDDEVEEISLNSLSKSNLDRKSSRFGRFNPLRGAVQMVGGKQRQEGSGFVIEDEDDDDDVESVNRI